jgi:predicted GIY-YIG superfamily endonuclease
MQTVYVLQSEIFHEKVYVGVTNNVERRMLEHNQGLSGYTSNFRPWKLLTTIQFHSRSKAEEFERYLKNGSGFSFLKRHFLN